MEKLKKIQKGQLTIQYILPIFLQICILKTNMICGIFMTKERIVKMNIARVFNICQTDWSGERKIPPHTQKEELWNRNSVEEVFSSDSQDNFGRELWDKCYELFCSYGVVFWLASKTYLGFIYILVSCTTLCSDIRGWEYLFALETDERSVWAQLRNFFSFCELILFVHKLWKLCFCQKLGETSIFEPQHAEANF